jgi:hypothetical protein
MKPISLFVPFEPIERRGSKSDPLIVSGYCFVNETVEGEGGIVIERAAMQAATPEYASRGTIREMHGPHAAGRADSVDWDPEGRCHIVARIVDPVAAMKCEEGVYRGFSIKVRPTQRLGNRVKALKWAENSLVDDPADPDCNALTLSRAEGFDPDAEVEVEVLDAPASPAAAAPDPEAAAVPDPTAKVTIATSSDTSKDPSVEASPSAGQDTPAEGLSHTEEQRAALIASGLPEGMLAGVEVVQAEGKGVPSAQPPVPSGTEPEAPLSSVFVEPGTGQRALGIPVVPIRENLAGGPTPSVEDVDKALGGGQRDDYYVEQAATGMWCAYSPNGTKLGEFDTQAEANAHVAKVKDSMKGSDDPTPGYRAAAVTPERVEAVTAELTALVARATALQRELAGEAPAAETVRVGNGKGEVVEARRLPCPEAPDVLPARNSAPETAVEEPPPAASETVSSERVAGAEAGHRAPGTEHQTSEIQRLQTANSELLQRLADHEKVLTRLAASEAEVKRLGSLPLDRQKPVVRYPHALSREFIANLGNEAEAETQRLRREYDEAAAEAKAERNGDRDKLNRATEMMILRASQLAERGVFV